LQALARRRLAAPVDGVTHVHAATAHRRAVSSEIVALDDHVPYAAAGCDELREARSPASGRACRGLVLRAVANRQELDVILAIERDRVVRAFAGVHAAGMHVEAELAV